MVLDLHRNRMHTSDDITSGGQEYLSGSGHQILLERYKMMWETEYLCLEPGPFRRMQWSLGPTQTQVVEKQQSHQVLPRADVGSKAPSTAWWQFGWIITLIWSFPRELPCVPPEVHLCQLVKHLVFTCSGSSELAVFCLQNQRADVDLSAVTRNSTNTVSDFCLFLCIFFPRLFVCLLHLCVSVSLLPFWWFS